MSLGLIYVQTSRPAQQMCDLERVKPLPLPSLRLRLESVQSCLGIARVMRKRKVPRKFLTYLNYLVTASTLFSFAEKDSSEDLYVNHYDHIYPIGDHTPHTPR
uniref:Uncharacterized protein n=1 Tax=Araneus ventricosus TaxID=182803 RepID=A0A4Y2UKK7_ARAVE|nr:hypothetical protein AVEN_271871-1 [Araneus ventricosus]